MLFAPGDARLTLIAALRHDSDAIIIELGGELDVDSAPTLREHLGRVWELSGVPALVLDLTDLVFCDTAGLGELVRAFKRSQARGVRLVLTGVAGPMRRVLELTGLREVFEIRPTTADAMSGLLRPF
ncbi:STAS domain-containing protein [Planobispora takensis]|uniref:Anti-sigma factor antagonist n=1 Tax=Planobispora takensis TaxID=1367882 RepID=A0A8J3SQJ9_9ACTN|nr:STAS domain-containing protein [Planobispora takensis]GIH98467.1 hypothetical protein Pta02_04760 [Planobispora takensis]